MKKHLKLISMFLFVLGLMGVFALVSSVKADDISAGQGSALRSTGGRLRDNAILALGTNGSATSSLTVARIAGGTLTAQLTWVLT